MVNTHKELSVKTSPIAYFITFTTYGSWLHGDNRGSVLIKEKSPCVIGACEQLHQYTQQHLKHPPVQFNEEQRHIVCNTMIRHCDLRQWRLLALHVRSNHVHALVRSQAEIERVMGELKAWATRCLHRTGHDFASVWTQHGSTQYIFTDAKLYEKAYYIIHEQGEPMALFIDDTIARRLNG